MLYSMREAAAGGPIREESSVELVSNSFKNGGQIPGEFAFCVPDPKSHVSLGRNLNPHLRWSDVPAGTKSFALICCDPDVPSRGDDVNQEGRKILASLPRVDFFHWVLLDIPADAREIAAGSHSSGVVARGKSGPAAPQRLRHGLNDYTKWFASDEAMKGDYHGYDGPCPPWNDELPHRYVFTLYALDVPRLNVAAPISGGGVRAALAGHVIAEASVTGIYSLKI
jgi:Raf kinase inhibitor-like YbhB/YbcL family protein